MLSTAEFADTYDPPGYDRPFDLFRDYYAGFGFQTQAEVGATRISEMFDISESRVRGWFDGAVPDVVRGIEIAETADWLDSNPDTSPGHELAILTMGAYVCGSVSHDTYRPRWGPETSDADSLIWSALQNVGIDPRRGNVGDYRPVEITVSEGGAVLGRALVALGAPHGEKTAETVPPLPGAFFEAGEDTRLTLARLLLLERGTEYDDKATISLQMNERTMDYRESVGQLLRSLTDEQITVGENVTVSADAARELGIT